MGQPRPGALEQVNGEGIRLDGRRHATILYAYRRAWGPAGAKGDLTSPALDPPPRARPAMVYQSLWERRGKWVDEILALGRSRAGTSNCECGPRKPRVAWTFIAPVAGTTFFALAKLINQPAPGFGKRFC